MITISAFQWVPDFARGLVRDLRVRWALEETGLPYRTRLLSVGDQQNTDEYRALQPFGQVPFFEEDGFVLFETGAIVLYIAERSEALLPKEPLARARTTQWAFAALNSVEPWIMQVVILDIFRANEPWSKAARPSALDLAQKRLAGLSKSLGDKLYLDGDRFTAGDLLMSSVLRIMPPLTNEHANLKAYLDRCTSRPTFQRALAAQLGDFQEAA